MNKILTLVSGDFAAGNSWIMYQCQLICQGLSILSFFVPFVNLNVCKLGTTVDQDVRNREEEERKVRNWVKENHLECSKVVEQWNSIQDQEDAEE